MKVDRAHLMENGFIILRNVVPPATLGPLRDAIEHMVEGRRERSAQMRLPHQPPGGTWADAGQPTLYFDTACDRDSAIALDFLLGETTLGVCRQLIEAAEVAPHSLATICSSDTKDTGPSFWHRDVGPGVPAPLIGMIANMERHGPSYLQWNIALYDDSVFWIVPRSHKRVTTEAENKQLFDNTSVPLPGGMPVELGAGDGVVYTHLLLHWGSNYTRKMRRTIHPGYRPFSFASMPNVHWRHWEPGFYHHLSEKTRAQFEAWDALFLGEVELHAQICRAIIDRNADAFAEAFDRRHPSPHERLVSLAMLNNLSRRLDDWKQGKVAAASVCLNERDSIYFDSFFTAEDAQALRLRFAELDRRLRLAEEEEQLGWQRYETPYRGDEMPADFTVDDFVASWS